MLNKEKKQFGSGAYLDAASRLKQNKDQVVSVWLERALVEVEAAKNQNRTALIDSLPTFLDQIIDALVEGNLVRPSCHENICVEHGEQRANTEDYSLDQMIREYHVLRVVIFETLERTEPLTIKEREIILRSIEEGVMTATAGFLEMKAQKIAELNAAALVERQKFEGLFAESPAAMALLIGPSHIFEKANSLYMELVGHRDILGKPVLEALPEFQNEPYIGILDNVFKTGVPFYGKELKVSLQRTPNGPLEQRYLDFTYQRLNDKAGNPYGVFAHAVDVTEKVETRNAISKAAEAMRESEKQFRTFTEAMPQMAFIATPSGEIIYFNQRFYDYVGLGKETGGWGWKDLQIQHPDDLEKTLETWENSVRTGRPYEIEYRLRRHDGQYRWHLGRAIPVRSENGRIIKWFGTNTDIEDQKRVVSELEREREVKEQYVRALTHDLRNPLFVIKASTELMIKHPDSAEYRERGISKILSAVDRSDNMIQDLLDVGRIRAGQSIPLQKSECDLRTIAEEVLEEFRISHGDRFVLEGQGPIRGIWSCSGLRRIMENLINNAIKYGSKDTEVRLSLGMKDKLAWFSVHNFGPPISPEDQKILFLPFQRAESAESSGMKGWGLGLTLVKGLTEAHHGEVQVVSTAERGTIFQIKIPQS